MLLVLLFVLSLPAKAQTKPTTLQLKNVPLLAALDSIRHHAGYQFSYNLSLVPFLQQTRVTIQAPITPIETVLTKLFAGTGIKHRIIDKTVLLSKTDTLQPEKPNPPVLYQTVKGKVVDKESLAPLAHVSITLINTPDNIGTITDTNGLFSLKAPIGRQSLLCTVVGYHEYMIGDMTVISGKETFLTIEMKESVQKMQEVIVHAAEKRDRALNPMATVSTRMLTPEDAARYAAGYNDPARMVTAFAGIISGGNRRNNMVIRGNSPKGLLWKLEGIEIPAPNHFSEGQGDAGGIFNIIASDQLSNFDFFTGAFPAEYGNALSGILDLNLRKGNADKAEYGLQLGMIGTQVSLEGPISKRSKSSYLLNYRYGNLQFLNNLGLIDLDDNEKPAKFQDFNLHINLPTRKAGNFSIFAIGGVSTNGKFSSKDSMSWRGNQDLRNEETNQHQMGVLGLKHSLLFPNKKTSIRSTLAVSWLSDRFTTSELDHNLQPIPEDSSRYSYPTIRLTTTLNHKFNAANIIRTGFTYSQFFFDVYGKKNIPNVGNHTYLDQDGNTASAEAFFQWKHRLSKNLEINSGLHATYFLLNEDIAIEPRLGAKWQTSPNGFFSYGFGLHSKTEPISLYFAKITNRAGVTTQPNRNLKMTRAMHQVLGYEFSLSKNLRIKAEAYYQYLYKVPVVDDTASALSTINTLRGITDSAYVNKGKGYNKGIELTIEKFFADDYYFLAGGTIFDSKYKPANGKKYNTYFNTGYQVNFLAGKDFRSGNAKQHLFSMNAKVTVHGGFRYSLGRQATSSSGIPYIYYPMADTYSAQTPQFVQIDAGFKYRHNNRRYSWILSLDIQNLTNRKNVLDYKFMPAPDNRRGLGSMPQTDLGIIPILNLKVEF
jgi:hypothetical protein